MLIRIWIHCTHPLAGTAASKGSGTLSFDGWLELLRVISQLAGTETAARESRREGRRLNTVPTRTAVVAGPDDNAITLAGELTGGRIGR